MLTKNLKQILHLSFLFISIILTSCTPRTHVTGICKSCKPYVIKGRTYYPQKYYDYDETGIASWYGGRFHGQKAAHGGIYNMHQLTAAHRTLPLPSVVEVVNLKNGKKVVLVIDDRGPFIKGRIIDLSKEAANQLGIHDTGLGRVRIRTIIRESEALSRYLKHNGKLGHDLKGRSWVKVYEQEIKGKAQTIPYLEQYPVPTEKLAPKVKIKPAIYKTDPETLEPEYIDIVEMDENGELLKASARARARRNQIAKAQLRASKSPSTVLVWPKGSIKATKARSGYPSSKVIKPAAQKKSFSKAKNLDNWAYEAAWNGVNSK